MAEDNNNVPGNVLPDEAGLAQGNSTPDSERLMAAFNVRMIADPLPEGMSVVPIAVFTCDIERIEVERPGTSQTAAERDAAAASARAISVASVRAAAERAATAIAREAERYATVAASQARGAAAAPYLDEPSTSQAAAATTRVRTKSFYSFRTPLRASWDGPRAGQAFVPSQSFYTVRLPVPEHADSTGSAKSHRMCLMPSCTSKVVPTNGDSSDEDTDGRICPICLDVWEDVGSHRLVSLECGHLFGHSCIRRWLRRSNNTCPECRHQSPEYTIRILHARSLRAANRTLENHLRMELEKATAAAATYKSKNSALQKSNETLTKKLKCATNEIGNMKKALQRHSTTERGPCASAFVPQFRGSPKLVHNHSTEVLLDEGCRVICHAKRLASLIMSQRTPKQFMPCYGLRFIDTQSLKCARFICTSVKSICDVSLSSSEDAVITASKEPRCRTFDPRSRKPTATLSGTDMRIWSCAFDTRRFEHYIYLGGQNGTTYVVDNRKPHQIVMELETPGDTSSVMQIAPVAPNMTFPMGGVLVCKIQSLWFFEYNGITTPTASVACANGPYYAVNYNAVTEYVLLSGRANGHYDFSRNILGKLKTQGPGVVFLPHLVMHGTSDADIPTRSTQINVENNSLAMSFMHDTLILRLYETRNKECVHSMRIHDTVYDACPVYLPNSTLLACVTDTKCCVFTVAK